eukprot:Skav219322  [mRNA]  locus=scaffold1957:282733:287183:- [translate_table: standard]
MAKEKRQKRGFIEGSWIALLDASEKKKMTKTELNAYYRQRYTQELHQKSGDLGTGSGLDACGHVRGLAKPAAMPPL